ncbi:hypothetical protein BDW71DRAFT_185710 [Aspergillus fruticulosus]
MVTPLVLLLWAVAATLADDDIWLNYPLEHDILPTNNFTIVWSCNYECKETMTVELSDPAATGSETILFLTTVAASESSTTLPARFLPAMRPSETSVLDLEFYYTTSVWSYGFHVTDISLVAPTPSTVTQIQTETVTTTPPPQTITATVETLTPEATTNEDNKDKEGNEEDTETKGLSTGAKAGIGVGVGAGVLLFAAGGLILFRSRRHRGGAPKAIREISNMSPKFAVSETGEDPDRTRPSSLPLPLLAPSASGSAKPPGERHELSG